MSAACEHGGDAAAYALGALDEREWPGFAAHLVECEACAGSVVEMQHVVDWLPGAVPPHEPPPTLRDRIMADVEAEAELLRAAGPEADRPARVAPRRGRRWLLSLRPLPAAGLAAVLLAMGIGGGVLVEDGDDSSPARTVVASVASAAAPAGEAQLRIGESSARLVVSGLPAPPEGRIYQVWLDHPADGAPPKPTAVLFSVNRLGHASVDVPGDLGDVSTVLVTDEPLGGSSRPSGDQIITAQPS